MREHTSPGSDTHAPISRGRILELRVRNHPGAMSHITGLFARRAFNLESILCVPNTDDGGATSTMLLGVADEPRLDQVEQQIAKLHDVLAVRHRDDLTPAVFTRMLPPVQAAGETA